MAHVSARIGSLPHVRQDVGGTDYDRGFVAGLERAADVCDNLWSRYEDWAARAALGLAADEIRAAAVDQWFGRDRGPADPDR